jgi:hypothetical protein
MREPLRREAAGVAEETVAVGGPTAFLGLDRDERVRSLTDSVPSGLSGGEVLRSLLLYRHRTGRPMDSWTPVAPA